MFSFLWLFLCIFIPQENTSSLISLALREVWWRFCCTGMEKGALPIHCEPSSSHAKARHGPWNSGLYQSSLFWVLLELIRLNGVCIVSNLPFSLNLMQLLSCLFLKHNHFLCIFLLNYRHIYFTFIFFMLLWQCFTSDILPVIVALTSGDYSVFENPAVFWLFMYCEKELWSCFYLKGMYYLLVSIICQYFFALKKKGKKSTLLASKLARERWNVCSSVNRNSECSIWTAAFTSWKEPVSLWLMCILYIIFFPFNRDLN